MKDTYTAYYENSNTYANLKDSWDILYTEIKDEAGALGQYKTELEKSSGNIMEEHKEILATIEATLGTYIDKIEDMRRLFEANAKRGDEVLSYWREKEAKNDVDHYVYYDDSGNEISSSTVKTGSIFEDSNDHKKYIEYSATKGTFRIGSVGISEANGYIEVHLVEEVQVYRYVKKYSEDGLNYEDPNVTVICGGGQIANTYPGREEILHFNFDNHIV